MGNDRTVWFPAFCQPLALCSPMPCSKSHVVMDVLGHLCWMACSCTLVAWGVFPSPRGNFQEPLGGFISCRVCNIWDLRGKTPTSHFFPLVFFFLPKNIPNDKDDDLFFYRGVARQCSRQKQACWGRDWPSKNILEPKFDPCFDWKTKRPLFWSGFFWGGPPKKNKRTT